MAVAVRQLAVVGEVVLAGGGDVARDTGLHKVVDELGAAGCPGYRHAPHCEADRLCASLASRTLGCASRRAGHPLTYSDVPQREPQLHPYVRVVEVRREQRRAPGDALPHGVAVHGQGDRRTVPTAVQGEPGAQGLGERGVGRDGGEQGAGVGLAASSGGTRSARAGRAPCRTSGARVARARARARAAWVSAAGQSSGATAALTPRVQPGCGRPVPGRPGPGPVRRPAPGRSARTRARRPARRPRRGRGRRPAVVGPGVHDEPRAHRRAAARPSSGAAAQQQPYQRGGTGRPRAALVLAGEQRRAARRRRRRWCGHRGSRCGAATPSTKPCPAPRA